MFVHSTSVNVAEIMTLDGFADNPTWTAEFGFDPAMGQTLAEVMAGCDAILLGRTTYEMFAPAWSTRTVEDDQLVHPDRAHVGSYDVIGGVLCATPVRRARMATVIGRRESPR